jgi:hypothetical protein
MKKAFVKIFLLLFACFATSFYANAQQFDSLINQKSVSKLFYLEDSKSGSIKSYIEDTADWVKSANLDLGDLKKKNELLVKTVYCGKEYENPALVLLGYSSGFELYRDSVLIYSTGERFNPKNPGHYFDTHIIELEKPLTGSVFVLRVHFRSYLDIAGFTTMLIGEAPDVAEKASDQVREMQSATLPDLLLGVFLLIAGLFALAAFIIRIKKRDWLLFWFFVFAASQGYVFILEYLWMIVDISPSALISSTVIVENLVPAGIIGIIAMITGYSRNFFIRLMIVLHLVYTALHLSMIHFDIFNVMFWVLIIADIVLFVFVLIRSKIYKNPDFKLPVIALCALMILVILDIFAVFGVFYIAEDLSSYGMLLVVISFAWYIERNLFRSRKKNLDYQIEITETQNKLLSLENENVIAQYETLKNQVNPHFLFNSLNVLSSLIRHDDKKALRFIEEFADIYRYVLDANDKTIIEAHKEISFVNSYLYLQKLRYEQNLEIVYDNMSFIENRFLVPLSIQILVENAIKHNEISAEFPLRIKIYSENDYVIVSNEIHKLNYEPESKRIGLNNLSARYALITETPTVFGEFDDLFVAKIPLIKMED